ncbi:MAG: hypothetical protein ACYCVN_09250 [Acidimicrobiales bacterium]
MHTENDPDPLHRTVARVDAIIGPDRSPSLVIDCADCSHRSTPVCDDCIVSFIIDRDPEDAVVVDADEARALRMLEQAGIVPAVRHSRCAG